MSSADRKMLDTVGAQHACWLAFLMHSNICAVMVMESSLGTRGWRENLGSFSQHCQQMTVHEVFTVDIMQGKRNGLTILLPAVAFTSSSVAGQFSNASGT